jgi:branched-chain amino acid transport system substrate-binding protein
VGPTDYTFAAYDCADTLIAAIERAIELKGGNLPNRRDVLDAMQTITYIGLTGTYSFDHNGDALSPLMSIYQVHNGKWEYLQKLDATAAG